MKFIPAVFLFIVSLAISPSNALSAETKASASWRVLSEQAQVLNRQGNLDRAIEIAQQALAQAKTEFGANSPEAAESMVKLAELYRAQSARLDSAATQARQSRNQTSAPSVAQQKVEASVTTGSSNKLVFGVIAPQGVDVAIKNWRPFADAMSAKLQMPIELVAAKEYKELVDAFKQGRMDIAWISNVPALEIVEAGKGAVFVQTIDRKCNCSGYKSLLLVHKDSKVQSLKDILVPGNGLIFGNGDEKSTSGYLVPLFYAFVQNKVNDPSTLFKEIKVGNHQTNIMRVAQKEVDVATTNDVELGFFKEKNPDLGKNLRPIWYSQEIPQSPFIWRRDLPIALKRQISQYMIAYGKTDAERKVLSQANDLGGFKRSSNRQLVPIADLEMFNAWRKLWNNRELSPDDRKKQERVLSARSSRLEIYLRATEEY